MWLYVALLLYADVNWNERHATWGPIDPHTNAAAWEVYCPAWDDGVCFACSPWLKGDPGTPNCTDLP